MPGRKAHYTTRIAKRICEHIALGDTLQRALAKEPLAPAITTFWRWIDEYPEFAEMYGRARMMQADLVSDSILEMASAVLRNPKFAPAYKVASDILRWQTEVHSPAKYGQKVQIEHKAALDPAKMRTEIKQLEAELGLLGHELPVMDVVAKEIT